MGGGYISSVLHVLFELRSNILQPFLIYLIRATRAAHRSFLHLMFMFMNVRMIKGNVDPVSSDHAPRHKITWGREGTSPPFLSSALMQVSGHLHALATLSPVLVV
jgi:hypothetical protein